MKIAYKVVTVVVLAVFAPGGLSAQQGPAAQDSGPSKQVTMNYIQDRLNDINLSYALGYAGTDIVSNYRYAVTGTKADASSCSLSFHETAGDEKFPFSSDKRLSFKDVKSITVETREDQFRDPVNGKMVVLVFTPTVYAVRIKMIPGKKVSVHKIAPTAESREEDSTYVEFLDWDMANRVARALDHAADLCGAVDNDPFK